MGIQQFDPAAGLNAAVAAVLEGERAAARMTLQELADASGVSYRTLQRYAARERNIELAALDRLARVFHTTPEHLLAAAQERLDRGATPSGLDPGEVATARAVARAVAKKSPPRTSHARSSSSRRSSAK